MKPDRSLEKVIELTEHQEQRAVYGVICDHFEERLEELRLQGDNLTETQVEGAIRKGRIDEIKRFLDKSKTRPMKLGNVGSANYD